jgi:hypothetical protein
MNRISRIVTAVLGAALAIQPATAQFYWQAPDFSAPAIKGGEESFPLALPGSTPTEYRGGLVWNLRAAMNVAALQCDFEPTLLMRTSYNEMIAHHKKELDNGYTTLNSYFKRVRPKTAQFDFDQYNTRIYSGYSTVQAQTNFCQIASSIARDAIFAERATLHKVAEARMPELRNALKAQGELFFGNPVYGFQANIPSLADDCWTEGKLKIRCKASWDAQAAQRRKP